MKVQEARDKLKDFNPDAEMGVIVHNKMEQFTLTWGGGGEGETKSNCKEVNFYIDRLCQSENKEVKRENKN